MFDKSSVSSMDNLYFNGDTSFCDIKYTELKLECCCVILIKVPEKWEIFHFHCNKGESCRQVVEIILTIRG